MKELSLNILDITQNSITAGAKNIGIFLTEDEKGILTIRITDDGCGMKPETLNAVSDPFYTSRTTRKVGLGIPFLRLAANQAGGDITITSRHISESPENHGTEVTATFDTHNIDFTPIGDITETLLTLLGGNDGIDFTFEHKTPSREVRLSTKELKEVLGEEVKISEFEVLQWIKEYLNGQYNS